MIPKISNGYRKNHYSLILCIDVLLLPEQKNVYSFLQALFLFKRLPSCQMSLMNPNSVFMP